MKSFVLDASVAAKWFLPRAQEPLLEESLEIFDDYRAGRIGLRVPDLFWPEFGNIFWRAARNGRISWNAAEASILMITALKIPTESSAGLVPQAFAIAKAFGRTLYDGTYVALAIAAHAPLVTADERLVNAVGGHYPVRWLGATALD